MGQISYQTLSVFTDACLRASKPENITEPLTAVLAEEGISSWFVGSLAHVSENGRGFGFYGIPKGWQDRYIERGYHAHDPVFQHAMAGKPRITWSNCQKIAEENSKTRTIFNESADFGLKDGFIMPVHGFGDLPGCVTYGGEDLDLGEDMQMSLLLLGAYAFEGLRRLVENFHPIRPVLTPQELRILRWSAEGKSANDISNILRISEHTVRAHHKNIKTKYAVGTMVQACVLAALDGTLRTALAC